MDSEGVEKYLQLIYFNGVFMFEVKENQKVLPDGTQITTFTREVISTLVIEAEAGTTGFKGGGCQLWRSNLFPF